MARNVKKLPKWAIKKHGISKAAWAAARRGRPSSKSSKTKSKPRKTPRKVGGGSTARKGPGMFAKLNAVLRGVKIGLPGIAAFTSGLSIGDAAKSAAFRYTGFSVNNMAFDVEGAKTAAGFYAGNLVEQKALSALRIPQMAGQKKILALAGQYLPEAQAAADLMQGADPKLVGSQYGVRSIGYEFQGNTSWFTSAGDRDAFLKSLGARLGLGLASRFIGSMVNKYLPKGVNL